MIGYNSDPITKKLFINEEEAKVVRLIFEKYMALGSLKQTVTEINALGLKTREWTSISTGKLHKAKKWDTGTVYRILSNPVYAGYTKFPVFGNLCFPEQDRNWCICSSVR